MKLVRAKEGYRKVGDKYLLAKKCTKCGRWLVASTVNFHRNKTGKYGLNSHCKTCAKEYRKKHYEQNKDRVLAQNKEYRDQNKDKAKEYRKKYYEQNKDKEKERNKNYYKQNKYNISIQRKERYEANKTKILEQARKNNKKYRNTPKGQISEFNRHNKRRHKKANQGTGVTPDQWLEMMQYFDFRCAYSGERLTDKTRSIDHIVPLNSGGDNMIWNCVPMKLNYNSSKCAKDMLEWYREQDFYSEDRLAKIYEWQEYARKKWKNS